mgnify:FL=1|tara:strand:+ start:191 stop:1057 length:867 start_codon:yes stop_codon:yes gene_type:complete
MSDTLMAEKVKPEEKVAFANRKYSNEERIKKEEEELAALVAEQKGEVEPEEVEEEKEPTNAEEKSFKKRYGDLRRHSQKQLQEHVEKINALQSQLEQSTKQEIKLPKSDEDIEAWAKDYPDVAAIVETIAIKKAKEQSSGLEARVKEIDEMREKANRDRAEVELMTAHPDFADIRDSDEFHEWAEEQPKSIQDALYENDNDARAASRAIDLYKADKGIKTKKSSSGKDAAKAVSKTNTRSEPSGEDAGMVKESVVQKMSAQQYEKNADKIMEAIRSGKFVYDISGNAR